MPLPLSGLLVVSLEQAVAAPMCSCRLADAGARVVKVERPEGDFARYYDSVAQGESAGLMSPRPRARYHMRLQQRATPASRAATAGCPRSASTPPAFALNSCRSAVELVEEWCRKRDSNP